MSEDRPIIWTNMRFWQSALWRQRVHSIFSDPEAGAATVEFLSTWKQAWRLFRKRQQSDVIVTMGVRESMVYALLCAVFFLPSKQVMMEVFIDSLDPSSPLWRIKTWLYGWLARRSIGMVTNSSAELSSISERFGMPPSRLKFIPLCSTIPPEPTPEPKHSCILAAGRTLRDFPLLIHVAASMPDVPFEIICGSTDLVHETVPANVQIFREVPISLYLQKLRLAQFVVIPLLPTPRSTGQVVLLEAMAMGKPVIATRSPGTVDYIRDGETGFMVEEGNPADMLAACRRLLEDASLRQRMGDAARVYVEENGIPDRYANEFLDVIDTWIQ